MVEGHVPQGVEVQVLSSAQIGKIPTNGDFLFGLDRNLSKPPAEARLIDKYQTTTCYCALCLCEFIHNDRFELVTVSFKFCTRLWEFNGEDDLIANRQTVCREWLRLVNIN